MAEPNKLNDLFQALISGLLLDLKDPDKRKQAYPTAVAILKNMDFGLVVKPGTPAATLRQEVPFPRKAAN